MAKAAKKKDPTEQLLAELATAREEGVTDLSVQVTSSEVMLAVCEVTTLTQLTIKAYTLPTLPPQIGNLTQLERLSVDGNKLQSLPPEIGKLTQLETIYAYMNQLEALPDEIGNLIALETLVLWDNKLRTLPASIGRLVRLNELDIHANEIVSLPAELGQMAGLKELDLSRNALTDLPADLSGMARLRELKLVSNKLTRIPDGVCTLPALALLDLEDNEITAISDAIAQLTTLRDLNLKENAIATLPDALFSTGVSVLNLQANQLRELPRTIGKMTALMELKLRGNPIENLPKELLEAGKEAVFEHLGLSEARVVTGDLPEPAARDAIVKARKQAIDDFVRATRRKMTDENKRDEVVAFVTGKTDRVPTARVKDHYSFGAIVDVLAPVDQWTFFDRRVLAYITQDNWHFIQPGQDYTNGFHREVLNWLGKQVTAETDDRLFSTVAGELAARGIDRDRLLPLSLARLGDELVRADGSPTSFGRWVIENAGPDTILAAAREKRSVKDAITPLLLAHAPALFEQVATELLAYTPNDKGEVHLAPEALLELCKSDPARWQPLLEQGLTLIGDCLVCTTDGCRILAECYPDQRARAFAMAEGVLAEASSRRNKERHFELRWSGKPGWNDGTAEFIDWMLARFGADAQPAITAYAENTKVFLLDVAEVVARALGQAGIDILGEGLKMSFDSDSIAPHFRRMFAMLAPLDWSKYHDKAWELATCDVRAVRQVACLALSKLPVDTVFERASSLLGAKKGAHREAGVMILGLLDHQPARKLLDKILDDETSDDVRDIAVQGVYREAKAIDAKAAARRVASASGRGKLKAAVATWADDKKLPPLKWAKGGKAVDRDTVRFLLHRQTRLDDIGAEPEARDIYPLIARNGAFATKLLTGLLGNGGAKAKNRFALSVVGLLGDDSVVDKLEEVAIGERNVNAVRTLGLIGSRAAAAALDRIARAFRTKYPNVREPAQDAFAAIADSMGLTPFELSDAMLPDLDLGGGRKLKAGKRTIDVGIGADRKVELSEAGKLLRTPPKEISAKQKAELKQLAVDLKETMRQLRGSLEYYLIVQRRWSANDWRAFFSGHPVARAFARSLVWGIFDGKQLVVTFRPVGDAGVGVDGAPVKLRDGIGLVHPLDVSPEQRAGWQAALTAEGLEPAFSQMARPVFTVGDAERDLTLFHRVEGRTLNSGTFKSRAERLGWRRGSVIDSGEVSAYRKLYPTHHIEAFVRLEGLNVQSYDFDGEVTLHALLFVRTGAVVTGSYTYDEPTERDDPRLIAAGTLPPIVYSETVADLESITRRKDDADE